LLRPFFIHTIDLNFLIKNLFQMGSDIQDTVNVLSGKESLKVEHIFTVPTSTVLMLGLGFVLTIVLTGLIKKAM